MGVTCLLRGRAGTKMRHALSMAAALALCAGLAAVAGADTLITKSGTEYVGTVSEEEGSYVLVTPTGGRMEFPRTMVRSVMKGPVPASQPAVAPVKASAARPKVEPAESTAESAGPATKPTGWSFKASIPQGFDLAGIQSSSGMDVWVLSGQQENGIASTLIVARGRPAAGQNELGQMIRAAMMAAECAVGVPVGSSGLKCGGAITLGGDVSYMSLGTGIPATFKFTGKGVSRELSRVELWAGGMVARDGKPDWLLVGAATVKDQRASVLERATELCLALKQEVAGATVPVRPSRGAAQKPAAAREAPVLPSPKATPAPGGAALSPGRRPTRPTAKRPEAAPRQGEEPAGAGKDAVRIDIAGADAESEKGAKLEWPFRSAVPAGFRLGKCLTKNGIDMWVLQGDPNGRITETLFVLRVKNDQEKGLLRDCADVATFAAEAAIGAAMGSIEVDGNTGVTSRYEGDMTIGSLGNGSPPACLVNRRDAPRGNRDGVRVSCVAAGCKVGQSRIFVGGATAPENKSYQRVENAVRDLCKRLRQELAA